MHTYPYRIYIYLHICMCVWKKQVFHGTYRLLSHHAVGIRRAPNVSQARVAELQLELGRKRAGGSDTWPSGLALGPLPEERPTKVCGC